MSTQTVTNDEIILYDTKGAAHFLKCSVPTLERWRLAGIGPQYIKGPGKRSRVFYTHDALVAWLKKHTFNSTSEY